jgi:hypothetical protein
MQNQVAKHVATGVKKRDKQRDQEHLNKKQDMRDKNATLKVCNVCFYIALLTKKGMLCSIYSIQRAVQCTKSRDWKASSEYAHRTTAPISDQECNYSC